MYSKKENDFKHDIEDTLSNLHVHHKDVYIHTIKQVRNNDHPYEHVIGAEKILLVSVIFLKMLMPSFWIRHFSEQNKAHYRWLDIYNLLKPILFLFILIYQLDHLTIVMILITYLLIDLFVSIVSTLILSDIFVKPLSIRKQFLSLWCHLWEIILWFAILYLHYWALWYIGQNKQVWPIWAIYYSMCTLSTVWYWDIAQMNDIGSIISVLQMIYWLVFIGIILSAYVSKINIKSE
jgi:hypothetical protein